MNKIISPTIFGLGLICFLLPWVSVSCSGQKVLTFSGTDLAIGKTMEIPQAFGPSKKQNAREGRATIAFIAGIAGILSGFIVKSGRAKAITAAVCGGIGSISLYLLKSKLDSEIVAHGAGMISVDYQFGLWIAMLLFLGACIVNVLDLTGQLERISAGTGGTLPINNSPPKQSFCTQCGATIGADAAFCSECGHSMK